MIRQLIRLLLCIILAGGFNISSSGEVRLGDSLSAQSKKKKKKKKKSSKKKKSKKKKSVPAAPTSPPIINKGPKINVAAYADELYQLTGQLEASNKEMAKATRYIYAEKPKKKIKNIESLPFLTTGDYEADSRNNPNNIYIQRQLGLHYESVSNWEGAKDIYLRQIKKHPTNPDAHFYL